MTNDKFSEFELEAIIDEIAEECELLERVSKSVERKFSEIHKCQGFINLKGDFHFYIFFDLTNQITELKLNGRSQDIEKFVKQIIQDIFQSY